MVNTDKWLNVTYEGEPTGDCFILSCTTSAIHEFSYKRRGPNNYTHYSQYCEEHAPQEHVPVSTGELE